nr:hypothetical protein [Tanacetum cinerariifolium]
MIMWAFHICFVIYERQNKHFAPALNNECLALRAKHVTSPAKEKQALAVADNGSVRADEMPCGSTDPDDDNLWHEGWKLVDVLLFKVCR